MNRFQKAEELYQEKLARLSGVELNGYEKRLEQYKNFLFRMFWTDRKPGLEPEIKVTFGEHGRCVVSGRPEGWYFRGSLELNLIRPEHYSTLEECLHAYEAYSRGARNFLKPDGFAGKRLDFGLDELSSGMAHLACLVDEVLTAAAESMGKLAELSQLAKWVTETDIKRFWESGSYLPISHECIMGNSLNERFQFTPLPLSLIWERMLLMGEDFLVYLNDIDSKGKYFHRFEMGEALQLMSLAYGEDFLPLVFNLLDCATPEEMLKKAEWWIEKNLAGGREDMANLVRHQKPLTRTLVAEDFYFPVGEGWSSPHYLDPRP